MAKLKNTLSVLFVFIILLGTAAATELTITPPTNADHNFDVIVSVDDQEGFRGMEFTVTYDSDVIELDGASTTGLLASSSITVNEDDKIVIYSATPIDVSGDVVKLHFKAEGDAGDTSNIVLSDAKISVGTQAFVQPTLSSDYVTLSACVDYPNTHTGSGSEVGIPATSCACDEGTTLVVSPSTQRWACQVSEAESVFGTAAQACSLGGDPIYDSGFCCMEGYQLNQSFNNYNDLLGMPSQACTLIPNDVPRANIYQPPTKATVGNVTEFSSLGSTDDDGTVDSYDWDFGDNSTHSNLENPSHIYTSSTSCPSSVCTVALTITDDDGATDTFSVTLLLEAPPEVEEEEEAVPDPVCGNNIVETGEVCDGSDKATCKGDPCKLDCSGCEEPPAPPLTMQVGRTYTSSELSELGLQKDKDNTLADGRVATVNALGTITDIRAQAAPPIQTPVCGDGVCETGESAASCIQDCHTGDGVCQKSLGETPSNAPTDCKKSSPIIWIVLLLAALGGIGYFAIKKGWVSNIGPFGHASAQGPSGGSQFDLHRLAEKHEVAKPHKDLSKVISYINATKTQGFSYSQIKNALVQKGWKESDINAAYSKIGE